jgi:hypothetical protein
MLTIIPILSLILAIFSIIMMTRNLWVLKVRTHLITTDFDTFKKLPTYKTMMRKFWIWNIDKFIKPN